MVKVPLTATQSYTKRTISNLSPDGGAIIRGRGTCNTCQSIQVILTNVPCTYYVHRHIYYHIWISRQHFLLLFDQKLSYIMVLAHHFGRGIKPAISMQLRWSSLSLFGSCLYTSYVKFNGFFWLISSKICCYLTFKKFETLFYVTMSNSKAFLTNSAQKILCFSPF